MMTLSKHVPEILALLKEESKKRPKMRFGQLWENLLGAADWTTGDIDPTNCHCGVDCVYYMQDEELLERLREGAEELS